MKGNVGRNGRALENKFTRVQRSYIYIYIFIYIVAYYGFHSGPINVSKLVMLEPFNCCCNANIVAVQSEQCCISLEPIKGWYSHTIDGSSKRIYIYMVDQSVDMYGSQCQSHKRVRIWFL